jgi:hypothetical protein
LDRHKRIPCTNCGKLIVKTKRSKTGLCLICYNKTQSRNEKPDPAKSHHKVVLCSKCGKQIGENKTGLCINCYSLDIRKRHAEIHKKEEIRHVNTINMQANKLFKNYHPNPCKESPSGYHRWLINSDNIGTCFYCDKSEKMGEKKGKYQFNQK